MIIGKTLRSACATLLFMLPLLAGAQIELDLVRYTIISDDAVAVTGCTHPWDVELEIPRRIIVDGKFYTVQEICDNAFAETEDNQHFKGRLKAITLPYSLRKIGARAFYASSLKKIKLPAGVKEIGNEAFANSKLQIVEFPTSLRKMGDAVFSGCKSLTRQSGYHAGVACGENCFQSAPVMKQIESEELKSSFSYNCNHKVYDLMQDWQKRKSFETAELWEERMSSENREQMTLQFINQLKESFAGEMSVGVVPELSLAVYDEDYNLYAVNSKKHGTAYVHVPAEEKDSFEIMWASAEVFPSWGVKNDRLALSALHVRMGEKVYSTPTQLNGANRSNKGSKRIKKQRKVLDKEIDLNIPTTGIQAENTFVVAIGNEDYHFVSPVEFAENDMEVFAKYCEKTLGIPSQNIRCYSSATFGTLLSALAGLKDIAKAYKGNLNIIFYYAGHGIPNEAEKTAYLLPVDADGKQTEACFSLSRLYKELSDTKAKSVIVLMDACFSGAQRGEGMLNAARGVAIGTKREKTADNLVAFSAASGSETAYPYKEKGHGLFTYYLLKKLKETKGDVTLGELCDYVTEQVGKQSVVINQKSQTPTVSSPASLGDAWKSWKLR